MSSLFLLLLTSAMPASAADLLMYKDHSEGVAFEDAAALAGHDIVVTDDVADFQREYGRGGFDVVIVDTYLDYPPIGIDDVVLDRARTHEPVVYSNWALDTSLLQDSLGVTTGADLTTPLDLTRSAGATHDIFEGVPDLVTWTYDQYTDDGDALTPLGGWLAVQHDTGTGALAFTNGDTTAVLGFMPGNFIGSDNDADGHNDVSELLANMFDVLLAGRPTLSVDGACPSLVTLRLSGLTPTSKVALVSGAELGFSTIPTGSCAGTPLPIEGDPALLGVFDTDSMGGVEIESVVTREVCGQVRTVAVDLATCKTSAPLQL